MMSQESLKTSSDNKQYFLFYKRKISRGLPRAAGDGVS